MALCAIDLGNGFDGKFYKMVGKYNWMTSGCYINMKVFKDHLITHFHENASTLVNRDYQVGFQNDYLNRLIVVLKTYQREL